MPLQAACPPPPALRWRALRITLSIGSSFRPCPPRHATASSAPCSAPAWSRRSRLTARRRPRCALRLPAFGRLRFSLPAWVVVPAEQAPKAPGSELGDAAPAPATETALVAAEAPPGRISLRAAAEALLTAWDRQQGVAEALVALRAALARGARATAPGANASPAPTPSRRGYLPCSAVRRAPASPRSWNLPAGPHTRCAAFSPG